MAQAKRKTTSGAGKRTFAGSSKDQPKSTKKNVSRKTPESPKAKVVLSLQSSIRSSKRRKAPTVPYQVSKALKNGSTKSSKTKSKKANVPADPGPNRKRKAETKLSASPKKKAKPAVTPRKKKPKDDSKQDTKDKRKRTSKKDASEEAPVKKPRRRKLKLTPRDFVTDYAKDPTFESNLELPKISSLADSRLVLRYVLMKDNKKLKALLSEKELKIGTTGIYRCMACPWENALYYALKMRNFEGVKILSEAHNKPMVLAPLPGVMLREECTGHGSQYMFGHGMRNVTVGRGGKEGNAALLKDHFGYSWNVPTRLSFTSVVEVALEVGYDMEELRKLENIFKIKTADQLVDMVTKIVRNGELEIAAEAITTVAAAEEAIEKVPKAKKKAPAQQMPKSTEFKGSSRLKGSTMFKGGPRRLRVVREGYGFNKLHCEVLTSTAAPDPSTFKSVSVVKKCYYGARLTPLHFSAINPNPDVLQTLLSVNPSSMLLDQDQWSLLHYTAVCDSTSKERNPLKYLLNNFPHLSTMAMTKNSKETPLHLACKRNRLINVQVLIEYELDKLKAAEANVPQPQQIDKAKEDEDEDDEETKPKKQPKVKISKAKSFLDVQNKKGRTPLIVATRLGHVDIVKALVQVPECNVNKPTPAQFDRVTPFMVACQVGHLELVKYFVENGETLGVKLEAVDRRGRTALVHAVMNGHGHVVSYLLRVGVNHLASDSSGSTCVHYAAAYGWYFVLKLMLEAGCPSNSPNLWKVTPVAIAFLKGHMGLVELLLEQDDIDVNYVIDDQGSTLLLKACQTKPCKSSLDSIKFLLEETKADCTIKNIENRNCLHLLIQSVSNVNLELEPEVFKYLFETIDLLLAHGCSIWTEDTNNLSPFLLAVKSGKFELVHTKFLPLKVSPANLNPLTPHGQEFLYLLVKQAYNSKSLPLLKAVAKMPGMLDVLVQMAHFYNKEGLTPLLYFFKEHQHQHQSVEETSLVTFLKYLLDTLNSDVNAIYKGDKNNIYNVLHAVLKCSQAEAYLKLILSKKPDLEYRQLPDGKTVLAEAIEGSKLIIARILIEAGADVKAFCGSKDKLEPLLYYVANFQNRSTYELLPTLIAKGADPHYIDPTTGRSLLHLVASAPDSTRCIQYTNLLLERGLSPEATDNEGRTPLHVVIGKRTGSADCFYDVEDLLVETCPTVLAKADKSKRLPLHYAFINASNHADVSFMDPIELVSFLVRAMKANNMSEYIGSKDKFDRSPLHYAAMRGATISCALLLGEVPELLDAKDVNGNTPMGLAVRGRHEGCSLQFQQMGADFLAEVHPDCKKKAAKVPKKVDEVEWIVRSNADRIKVTETQPPVFSVLETVVKNDWQGILYLMLEKLDQSGKTGVGPGVQAAVKTGSLTLAKKLLRRIKNNEDLKVDSKIGTLFHLLALNLKETPNPSLVKDIVDELFERGIDLAVKDKDGVTALVHACVQRDEHVAGLFWKYISESPDMIKRALTEADVFGRTPALALFWNLDTLSSGCRSLFEAFCRSGCNPDSTCAFPVVLEDLPGVGCSSLNKGKAAAFTNRPKMTPLIYSVLVENFGNVKWLLDHVDINSVDSMGLSATMHVFRTNDLKMLKTLLNHKNYKPTEDPLPFHEKFVSIFQRSTKMHGSKLDLSVRDNQSQSFLHHLLRPSALNFTYTNAGILLSLLEPLKSFPPQQDFEKLLKAAKATGNVQIYRAFQMYSGVSKSKLVKPTTVLDENADFVRITTPKFVNFEVDYESDYEAMRNKILEETAKVDRPRPVDTLVSDHGKFEVVLSPEEGVPFDVVMTQVDLNYGSYGLYNFYKMQLVKQPKGKELIILFTRWGRVGEVGQYQQTPFATIEEGVKEFQSIFRAKSGNDWSLMKSEMSGTSPGFVSHPKKYTVITKNLKRGGEDEVEIKIDFKQLEKVSKEVRSQLQGPVFKLVKHLSLKSCSNEMLSGSDHHMLPFGVLDPQAITKGEQLIAQIKKLIKDRSDCQREQELAIVENIVKVSTEYFTLIPVHGYQTEKICAIFQDHDVTKQERFLADLAHIGVAFKMLLGAQKWALDSNVLKSPIDYMFSALKTRMELMDPEEEETQIILSYIQNTKSSSAQVKNIFRIERESDDRTQELRTKIGNRWLLWHGTKDMNLLSILRRGLQLAPIGAQLQGHLFGKGIYFADMFKKSEGYCSGKTADKFMLLCDVALGNVCPIRLDSTEGETTPLPVNYDSLVTSDSQYEPDPRLSICYKGRTVSMGSEVLRTPAEETCRYYGLHHKEYIVFNPDQVRIKYLVQYQ